MGLAMVLGAPHSTAWGQQGSRGSGEVAGRLCKGGPGLVMACEVPRAWPGEEPSPAATPRPGRAARSSSRAH